MAAYQQFQKDHPFPQSGDSPEKRMALQKERDSALLKVTEEWVKQWPDDSFAWEQRLNAISMSQDTTTADLDAVLDRMLELRKNNPRTRSMAIRVASIYANKFIHEDRIPGLIRDAIAELDTPMGPVGTWRSDLYPASQTPDRTENKTKKEPLLAVHLRSPSHTGVTYELARFSCARSVTKPVSNRTRPNQAMRLRNKAIFVGATMALAFLFLAPVVVVAHTSSVKPPTCPEHFQGPVAPTCIDVSMAPVTSYSHESLTQWAFGIGVSW
jgi:hypothetical protein